MTALIFDTTFILPSFGIEIVNLKDSNEHLLTILTSGVKDFTIYIPITCFLETIYLLNREYRSTNDIETLNRYTTAISTFNSYSHLNLIDPLRVPEIIKIANKIRDNGHEDIHDCWIAATAIYLDGIFVTSDKPLARKIKSIREYQSIICWTWSDFVTELTKKTTKKN